MSKFAKTKELFDFDKSFGCTVAGCDEAGRGPLAGPVVCAACVMPLSDMIEGIDDSKKVSEKNRETLYEQIIKKAINFRVAIIEPEVIDEINILNATKQGMTEAINGLRFNESAEMVLVDAVKIQAECQTMPIIKGDAKSYNIAAASIIAKVTRDRIMRKMAESFPDYGFEKNKGYGTAEHIAALKKQGACPAHRKSFIKNFTDYIEGDMSELSGRADDE